MTRRASHLIRRAAALLLAVALLPLAAAESPDPDTVISGLQQTLETTTDASFLVTGELLGGDARGNAASPGGQPLRQSHCRASSSSSPTPWRATSPSSTPKAPTTSTHLT